MANTLRFKRGLVATIPTALAGEPLFTTDTFDLYIGNGTTNTRFQKYIASGATTQILRGDGSLYTFPLNISSPSNGQVLKYDGTNWVNSADAGVTGSGTAGQVTYWGSSSTITGSNNLFWDATNNRLGIGTNAPSTQLHVSRAGSISGRFSNTTSGTNVDIGVSSGLGFIGTQSSAPFALYTNDTERARIFTTGNLHLGGTSDNGLRFQVTGDGFFRGSGNTSGSNVLLLENSDGTDLLTILNNGYTRYGNAGVSAPRVYSTSVGGGGDVDLSGEFLAINLRSTTTETSTFGLLTINGLNGTATTGTQSVIAINKGFAPTSGTATYTALLYNATINQTGGANGITRGLYVNPTLTAAADFRAIESNIASGTGRWNLYMNGTAANYLNGSLGVGTTNPYAGKIHISGANGVSNSFCLESLSAGGASFRTVITESATDGSFTINLDAGSNIPSSDFVISATGTERLRLKENGNLLIGTTTDAGFKLDINGTMRVSGASTIQNTMTARQVIVDGANNSNISRINLTRTDVSWGIYNETDLRIYYGIGNTTTPSTQYFSLGSGTGAATFSSSVTAGGNLLLTSGTASSVGAINLIRTGTSPVASRLTFGTDGTGYSFAIGKNQSGTTTDLLTILDSGAATFSSSVTSTQFRLSALNTAPATSSSTGTLGEIRIDADYIYVCTATNTWKRVAIATF